MGTSYLASTNQFTILKTNPNFEIHTILFLFCSKLELFSATQSLREIKFCKSNAGEYT